jgi:hypothetical protein
MMPPSCWIALTVARSYLYRGSALGSHSSTLHRIHRQFERVVSEIIANHGSAIQPFYPL